jgi:dipicolinate synthase subunit A
LEGDALRGIILKDDARYDHTENYLRNIGHVFLEIDTPPDNLNFVIFPFMREIDESIFNDRYFAELRNSTLIFSGVRNTYVAQMCTEYGLSYYAIMEDRGIALKNAVPTSEGVIAYLITNRTRVLANSRVLIIGYGVCGRDLSKRLKALGAEVSALVRSRVKECETYGDSIKPIYFPDLFNSTFDIIINTVPERVLTDEMLDRTENALLIDIASKPYGFDIEYAKKLNDKSTLLPGIPGKTAVRTAGEIIGEYINQVLYGRE